MAEDLHIIGGLAVRGSRNSLKTAPHNTGGHTHNFPHATAIWGRHRLIVYGKVVDAEGKPQSGPDGNPLRYEKSNVVYQGNGVLSESIIPVPEDEEHDLILLDPSGAHHCLFVPMEAVGLTLAEWKIRNHWTGFMQSAE